MTLKLDLGAGAHPRPGFTPVDRVAVTPDTLVTDLASGKLWPWKDSSVDELSSSHFIEHIPADEVEVHRNQDYPESDATPAHLRTYTRRYYQDRLLFFFDEAFRVIKPEGIFYLTWPALQSTDAFRDPTHRRFIPLEMLHYLSRQGRKDMGIEHYEAVCNWTCTEATITGMGELETPRWNDHRAYTVALRAEKT